MKNKIIYTLFFILLLVGEYLQGQVAIDTGAYFIKPISANTDYSDIGPWPTQKGIIFMSNRGKPRFTSFLNYTDPLTEERFYTLFFAERKDSITFSDPNPYHSELKAKYNTGPVIISKDGKTLILTRNVLKKKEADKQKDEGKYRFILQLFQYTYNEKKEKWEDETPFPYNAQNYNCAHAFLTSDGKRLYFSSDMPGGYGGMDIYVCEKNGTTWGQPRNMGNIVNSNANEIFPTLSEDDLLLYFSSDREGGLGGLDIYSCEASPNNTSRIQNIGQPVNSINDDFELIFFNNGEEGYFCSNRLLNGQSISKGKDSLNDNIYYVKPLQVQYNILIVDSLTNIPLISHVKLFPSIKERKDTIYFESGKQAYVTSLEAAAEYKTEIKLPFFSAITKMFVADKAQRNIIIPVHLQPIIEVTVKADNGTFAANTNVKIVSSSGKEYILKTNAIGVVSSPFLKAGETYTVTALSTKFHKEDSKQVVIPASLLELRPVYYVDLELRAFDKMVLDALVLFDLDKYNIRPDAKKILDSLIPKLEKYPEIDIRLEGHTDSRASYTYNLKLSENRANSVKKYLVSKGIKAKRITTAGYSYSRLVNKCKPKVKCTEVEHQANRRVEFLFSQPKNKAE